MLLIKKLLKLSVLKICSHFLKSKRLFNLNIRNRCFVFVFHDVSDKPSQFSQDCDLNVYPEQFKKQISWIRKHFNVLSPDEILKEVHSKQRVDRPSALITFDDGYKSLFNFALPYLEEQKIPAVLFLNGEVCSGGLITSGVLHYLEQHHSGFRDFCKRKIDSIPKKSFLNVSPKLFEEFFNSVEDRNELMEKIKHHCHESIVPADLTRFVNSQYIYYGNHMWDHFNGSILTENEFKQSIKMNNDFLEKYKNSRPIFSATFGVFDEKISTLALASGFELIFGHNTGSNRYPLQRVLKRISISSHIESEEEFIFEINKRAVRSLFP